MTDEEMLRRARMYMDKLSVGVNPIDDSPIPPGDTATNERLQKCFAYVAQALTLMLEGDDAPRQARGEKRPKRSRFYAECVELAEFAYSDEPMSLSEITAQINGLVQDDRQRRLPVQRVYQWLLAIGMIERRTAPDGQNYYIPTEEGADIGFGQTTADTHYGRRTVITCTREAQGFIADNIEAICAHRRTRG